MHPADNGRMRPHITRAGLAIGPDGTLGVRTFYVHGTAEEVAQNWVNGLTNATQKMTAGVGRVTTSPGQSAAASLQKWVNALSNPAIQQKWATQVGAVSLVSWQNAMTEVGIPRVSQGAQAKQAKFAAAMVPLLRFIDQGVAQVKQLDNSTYAAREQRMLTFVRYMRTYQKPAGT